MSRAVPRKTGSMAKWTAEQLVAGRAAFDLFRFTSNHVVPYDWADMGDAEKQRWIDRAEQAERSTEDS